MRLFAGIAVPASVRDAIEARLSEVRRGAGRLRWTRPAGWHLTLAFLGEVPDAHAGAVVATTTTAVVDNPPIALHLTHAGRFGPRVLWLAAHDDPAGAITQLAATLQRALAAAGLPVEQRRVEPHLTLARAGRDRVDGVLLDAVQEAIWSPGPAVPLAWSADEVVVWRSLLGSGPPRYEVVGCAPLAGAGDPPG